MGSDLYNNLIRYFVTHLKGLKEVRILLVPVTLDLTGNQQSDALQDEALLRYYAGEWDRYTTGANYINRLFTYLNRHWVKRERDEGRKGVYPVYTVRPSLICVSISSLCESIPYSSRSSNGNPTSSFMCRAGTGN